MANGDHELDILIKFGMDPTAARQAVTELNNVKRGTEAVSQEATVLGHNTDKATQHTHGYHRALTLLTRQFGEFGHILHYASFSLLAGGLAALAVAIHKTVEYFKNLKEEAEKAMEAASKAIGPTRDEMEKLELAEIKADDAFKRYQATVAESSSNIIADIKAQHDALITILKAEEAIAIARADDKDAAKEQFRQIESGLGLREKSQTIAEKESELQEVIRKGAEKYVEAQKELGALTEVEAKKRLAMGALTLPKLEAEAARLEQEKKKLPETVTVNERGQALTWWQSALGMGGIAPRQGVNPEAVENERRQKEIRDLQRPLEAQQKRLTTGVTAGGEAESLGKSMRDLTQEIILLRVGEGASRAAEPRQRVAALEEQRQKLGAAVDAAEVAGDWNAVMRGIKAMDSIGKTVKELTSAIVRIDAETKGLLNTINTRPQ
jgi:uncharacterized protein YoxC